jgi:hypothetical protein
MVFLVWYILSGNFLDDDPAAKVKSPLATNNHPSSAKSTSGKSHSNPDAIKFLPQLAFTQADTPLTDFCDDFVYTGRFVSYSTKGIQYDYYFSCDRIVQSEEEEESVSSVTLDDDYLKLIGFEITELANHSISLTYGQTKILFRNPF